ncbi:MAG: hypothetical protein A2046_08990 [Bacteroidetes bacterium GWA2_30_7]|nr:MAG: hypothetical protein A2046_08990 [Bacteroidetes bacterium GWA2_30_7]
MIKRINKILISLIFLIILLSCNQQKKDLIPDNKTSNYIIAQIDSQPIHINEIDNLTKQELYEQLYRIYIIRKVALEETINNKLLQIEAAKKSKTTEAFLSAYTNSFMNENNISNFTKKLTTNHLPELQRTLKYYDINSEKGKTMIKESYKKYLKTRLLDSLKQVHKITVNLSPPLPPQVSFENIAVHYRGNLNSKVTLIIVSDMECDKCREYNPIYEKLYQKYKYRIRFGFAHFASYVTLSVTASECSANQDKFWQMHDSIMNNKNLLDTIQIFDLAKKMQLNMEQFKKDFYSTKITEQVEYNFRILKALGLFGTPTIIVNGKINFNSSSYEEIEKLIIDDL